jgi:hypothetical protein
LAQIASMKETLVSAGFGRSISASSGWSTISSRPS